LQLVVNDLDLAEVNTKLFLLGRALVGQRREKFDLILQLMFHPAQRVTESIGAGTGNELTATDARGGAELGVPQPAKRRAKLVEKHHVDVVLDRQLQRGGAELHRRADENALDFLWRNELAFFFDGDMKAAVFEAQIRAGGVEDQLHGGLGISDCGILIDELQLKA
jgi:hypothetical protein